MPRLLTSPRASRTAGVLCALAMLCCARTAAADCLMFPSASGPGFDYAPPGSGLAGFSVDRRGSTFTLNVSIGNSFVIDATGRVAVYPCRYVVLTRGEFSAQENPGSASPSGVIPPDPSLPTSVSLSITIGPNPVCVGRDIGIRGSTTLEGFSGSASSVAYHGGYLLYIRQFARQSQLQPDGTSRCVPDDTGKQHKFLIRTKSDGNGVRG